MADEFEMFRKRSYHGGYDHQPLGEKGAETDTETVFSKVPPLKRSRSHPMGSRSKAPRALSPPSTREKCLKSQEGLQPSLLCLKHKEFSPDLDRGVVKYVLHTSLHSLVLLPKSGAGSPCHLCQRRVPQNNQHTRIITTSPANSSNRRSRKTAVCEATRNGVKNIPSPTPRMKERTGSLPPVAEPSTFYVTLLGHQGVGKATLVRTFATADDAAHGSTENECYSSGAIVSIMGDGRDDSLILTSETVQQVEERRKPSDAFVVVYAVNDKQSFEEASRTLKSLRNMNRYNDVPIIIAANKGDIVRSRSVKTKDGHDLAARYGAKYVEVSALLNIHVDELFLGVLAQSHFARELKQKKVSSDPNIVVHRKPPITIRAMGYIGKLFSKYRDCERDIENLFLP